MTEGTISIDLSYEPNKADTVAHRLPSGAVVRAVGIVEENGQGGKLYSGWWVDFSEGYGSMPLTLEEIDDLAKQCGTYHYAPFARVDIEWKSEQSIYWGLGRGPRGGDCP